MLKGTVHTQESELSETDDFICISSSLRPVALIFSFLFFGLLRANDWQTSKSFFSRKISLQQDLFPHTIESYVASLSKRLWIGFLFPLLHLYILQHCLLKYSLAFLSRQRLCPNSFALLALLLGSSVMLVESKFLVYLYQM